MPSLRLLPDGLFLPVCRWMRLFYVLSAAAMLASAALFFARGLNYGIDFRGGTLIEIGAAQDIALGDIRTRLSGRGLGDVQVQHFGSPREALIRIEARQDPAAPDAETPEQAAVTAVKNALDPDLDYRRVEIVGPKVSRELILTGLLAVLAAIGLVLVYIWARFEWQFSLGAVCALIHDIILTIGVFSFLHFEFNLSIIAAILTIVGYSLNDTVVVYDRVRENLRKYKAMPLNSLIDLSVAQTLARTLMTSVTTLIALFSLWILGGAVIEGFAFAMIWGVFVGTYSSIFVAAPLLLNLGVKRDWSGAQ